MYAIDVEPLPPRLKNNRDAYLDYLYHLKESMEIVREIVEEAIIANPLDNALESACLYTKHSQELLAYVVQVVLWYLDSSCSKHMTGNHSKLKNFVKKFIGTVISENDHFGAIMGYGDYVIGDSVISRVYYVEGLSYNVFSGGQFCYSDLEITFRKHPCFVHDMDGVDLLKGSRSTNLYTISVDEMINNSGVTCEDEAKRRNSGTKTKTFEENSYSTLSSLRRIQFAGYGVLVHLTFFFAANSLQEMDDPNITMEEYIQLMADKPRGHFETDFPAIVYNDASTSNQNVFSEPTDYIWRIQSNSGVTCEDEAKRRNSGTKTKTFEENYYLLLYAVSNKEDTAYQSQLITRIRVMINSLYGVSLFTYTPYAQLVIIQRYAVNVIDGN
ncbi:hypothetical protein Tco_0242613 [Tanacetum coccineum]